MPVSKLRLTASALLLLLLVGCREDVSPTHPKSPLVAASSPDNADSANAATEVVPNPDGEIIQEVWEESYLQGMKVGFAKTEVAKVTEDGQSLLRQRQTQELHLQRDGQGSVQKIAFTCWQTEDGRLVRFESQMSDGRNETRGSGKVDGNQLRTETQTVGNTQRQSHDWDPAWHGFFAQEESLRAVPLKPGEKRTVIGMTPVLNVPGSVKLEALDYEIVKLPSGEQKLLKVQSETSLGAQSIESLLWVDAKGEILKTRMPGLDLETFRTTKSAATSLAGIGNVDLLRSTVVKPRGNVDVLSTARRVVYRARLKEGKAKDAFGNSLSQQVAIVDEHTATLTVLAVRPGTPKTPGASFKGPAADDLSPGSYIQSDDPQVVELANSVEEGETDPWKVACALEKFVDETITEKNFASALATAADVARTKAGDCTEHAVLLAALCRARKIPSRVAFGLIYVRHLGGFAYHMWTEVWIEDRWIPLDATLGQGGIGCDHIKLGDSNLKGSESLGAMASVAQVLNQLELEIVE